MKFEDQQVNLELSKELKEAGYVQEGLWWWVDFEETYCADCKAAIKKLFERDK